MLAASAEFAAAVDAPVNTPLARVVVDLGDGAGLQDVSSRVTHLSVDRAAETNLPEQARLVVGYPAAQATITLGAGDGVDPVSWTYSPYRIGYALGGTVTVEIGYEEVAGEWLTVFTGFLHSVTTPSHQEVKLTALDGRAQMGALVNLPAVSWHMLSTIAYDFPGLDPQWVVDHLLRRSGYYASPPPRADCALSATMHGSVYPEIGYLNSVGEIGTHVPGPLTVQGVFGEAMRPQPTPSSTTSSRITWHCNSGVTLDYPYSLDVEGWFNTGGVEEQQFLALVGAPELSEDCVALSVAGTNDFYVDVRRWTGTGHTRNFHTGNLKVTPGWHYVACRVVFHADGSFRQWHRLDDQTAGPFDAVNGNQVAGAETVNNMRVSQPEGAAGRGASVEAFMVHNPQNTGDAEPSWWNDAYVGDVTLVPSLTSLAGTPEADDQIEAWRIAQEVAAAEFGVFGFDEAGRPFFRNRNWVFDRPHSVTVQRTLTATADVTALAAKLDTTQQHGSVTINATPYVPQITSSVAWSAAERHRLDGDLVVDVRVDAPILNPDTTFTQMTTNEAADGAGSQYRANTARDGSGTDLTASFFLFLAPSRVQITSSTTGGWLVGTDGRPALHFHTATIGSGDKSTIVKTSDATIQGLTVPDSPWRQRVLGLDYVVADLADDLATVRPVITDVEVIADPRLQLTDRVRLQDSNGLALDAEFWAESLKLEFAPGELTQKLSLRGVRAAFDPRDVADLSMWFDARWPDGSEASVPPADGSPVSSWTDIVGAQSVTQATAARQPTFQAAATLTAQPGVLFDGADDLLRGAVLPVGASPLTFFLVADWQGLLNGVYRVPIELVNNVFLLYEHKNDNRLTVDVDGAFTNIDYYPRGAGTMLIAFTRTGGAVDAWINGVKMGFFSGSGANSSTDMLLGCSEDAAGTLFAFHEGHVNAALFYDRVLSTVERQKIENYLARVYGIVLWKEPGGTG